MCGGPNSQPILTILIKYSKLLNIFLLNILSFNVSSKQLIRRTKTISHLIFNFT